MLSRVDPSGKRQCFVLLASVIARVAGADVSPLPPGAAAAMLNGRPKLLDPRLARQLAACTVSEPRLEVGR